jgi:hypothetical protein
MSLPRKKDGRNSKTRDCFNAFIRAVRGRLERGAVEYGDASFSADLPTLLSELEQEAEDLAGWSFILWSRLRRLRRIAEDAERRVAARSEADDGR